MEHRAEASWVPTVLDAWEAGRRLGAVGPVPLQEHLDHARRLAALLGPEDDVALDLGTGAGIPGLALAGYRPGVHWVLGDASQRRLRPVRDAVAQLGWIDRVTVVHARAEQMAGDPRWSRRFDVVVARLFGPPAVAAECAAPLLRPGGRLLVTEPAPAADERWPANGLRTLGLAVGRRFGDPPVQELVAVRAPDPRFPRRPGVAARRPLW